MELIKKVWSEDVRDPRVPLLDALGAALTIAAPFALKQMPTTIVIYPFAMAAIGSLQAKYGRTYPDVDGLGFASKCLKYAAWTAFAFPLTCIAVGISVVLL